MNNEETMNFNCIYVNVKVFIAGKLNHFTFLLHVHICCVHKVVLTLSFATALLILFILLCIRILLLWSQLHSFALRLLQLGRLSRCVRLSISRDFTLCILLLLEILLVNFFDDAFEC